MNDKTVVDELRTDIAKRLFNIRPDSVTTEQLYAVIKHVLDTYPDRIEQALLGASAAPVS